MNCIAKILKTPGISRNFRRCVGRRDKFNFEFEESYVYYMEKNVWNNPRESCFNMKLSRVSLPAYLADAIEVQLKSSSFKEEASVPFAEALWVRRPDLSKGEELRKVANVESHLKAQGRVPENNSDYTTRHEKKVQQAILRDVLKWEKYNYDKSLSLTYLHARGPPDYASLIRILTEIKNKDREFSPQTVFDFGSGVGTAFWAIDTLWPGECEDLLTVDASVDMNKINEEILEYCSDKIVLPSAIRRETYLSASSLIKYNLVVCSRSMLEMNKTSERCTVADLLWQKVADNGYLVVAEGGSFNSYEALIECREFLLEFYLRRVNKPISDKQEECEKNSQDIEPPKIQVFAPCTHEKFCPMYNPLDRKSCCFTVLLQRESVNDVFDTFSFFILKKQPRTVNYFPRIIKSTRRGGHQIFLSCTSKGTIEENVITKSKNSSLERFIAKNLNKGDHLPLRVNPEDHVLKANPVKEGHDQSDESSIDLEDKK